MVPFFVVLVIMLLIVSALLCFASIEIEVKKFIIDTEKKISNYLIYVKLRLISRITIIMLRIDNKKIEKYKNANNQLIKKINNKLQSSLLKRNYIKSFKIKLKKINLSVKVSLLDPFLTSICIGIISLLASTVIADILEEYRTQNCRYKIEPIYDNKLKIKLNLKCIINIKIIHILNTLLTSNKK